MRKRKRTRTVRTAQGEVEVQEYDEHTGDAIVVNTFANGMMLHESELP